MEDFNNTVNNEFTNKAKLHHSGFLFPNIGLTNLKKAQESLVDIYIHSFNFPEHKILPCDPPLLYIPDAVTLNLFQVSSLIHEEKQNEMKIGLLNTVNSIYIPSSDYNQVEQLHKKIYNSIKKYPEDIHLDIKSDLLSQIKDLYKTNLNNEDAELCSLELEKKTIDPSELPSLQLLKYPIYTDLEKSTGSERAAERIQNFETILQNKTIESSEFKIENFKPQVSESTKENESDWAKAVGIGFKRAKAIDKRFNDFILSIAHIELNIRCSPETNGEMLNNKIINFIKNLFNKFIEIEANHKVNVWEILQISGKNRNLAPIHENTLIKLLNISSHNSDLIDQFHDILRHSDKDSTKDIKYVSNPLKYNTSNFFNFLTYKIDDKSNNMKGIHSVCDLKHPNNPNLYPVQVHKVLPEQSVINHDKNSNISMHYHKFICPELNDYIPKGQVDYSVINQSILLRQNDTSFTSIPELFTKQIENMNSYSSYLFNVYNTHIEYLRLDQKTIYEKDLLNNHLNDSFERNVVYIDP